MNLVRALGCTYAAAFLFLRLGQTYHLLRTHGLLVLVLVATLLYHRPPLSILALPAAMVACVLQWDVLAPQALTNGLAAERGLTVVVTGANSGLGLASAQRGARLRAWLDRGGDNWCRIELPPMHPQDFDVRWEPPVYGSPVRIYLSPSTNASSAGPQPPLASTAWPQLRVGGASPDQPLFVLNAPYGNLRNQIEKGHRVGRAKSGLGSGHKVANAYFHLRAIQYTPRHTRRCLAARCHPCLQRIGVHAAAVFEATPPTA
ncbi:hypothetical protein EMIHUDRAFT_124330, partial [Emiliania huxleyi CCMP1516]|uniref:Mannosyltransferase n=2 Tax=Emiliania huxleyi TaxID=2903 RepID=A0A0D3IV74_EMIH1